MELGEALNKPGKKFNPPAFPVENRHDEKGMTLMEHYAGEALSSLTEGDFEGFARMSEGTESTAEDEAAKFCFTMAHAMLKERERRGKG